MSWLFSTENFQSKIWAKWPDFICCLGIWTVFFNRRPFKIFHGTLKIFGVILKSFLPGIGYLWFWSALIIFFSFCFLETAFLSSLALRLHSICTATSLGILRAESRWMPCPSPLYISKHIKKKVSSIYPLSVDKESEIEGGQMTSLTH